MYLQPSTNTETPLIEVPRVNSKLGWRGVQSVNLSDSGKLYPVTIQLQLHNYNVRDIKLYPSHLDSLGQHVTVENDLGTS